MTQAEWAKIVDNMRSHVWSSGWQKPPVGWDDSYVDVQLVLFADLAWSFQSATKATVWVRSTASAVVSRREALHYGREALVSAMEQRRDQAVEAVLDYTRKMLSDDGKVLVLTPGRDRITLYRRWHKLVRFLGVEPIKMAGTE